MAGSLAQLQLKVTGEVSDIERKLAGLQKSVDRFAARTEAAGSALFQAFSIPALAVGGLSLKAAAEFDALKRGLENVAGSSAEASVQLTRLREIAKLPGLGFREAIQGSISLQAAGFSADRAERSIKAFGNALVSVGKGRADLDGVILALTQMQNKSSGIGQELRQLADRLPQLRKVLTLEFNTGDSEEIAKLGYTSDQVVERILKGFEKLPKVSGGFANSLENLRDQLEQTGVKVGTALIPIAERAVTQLSGLLDIVVRLADGFGGLPQPVQDAAIAITGVAAAYGPAALVIGKIAKALGALASVGVLGPAAIAAGVGVVLVETSRQLEDLEQKYGTAQQTTRQPLFGDFKASDLNAQLAETGINIVRTGQSVAVSSDQIKRAFSALNIKSPFGQIERDLKAARDAYATLAAGAKAGAVSQAELTQAGVALAKMQKEANAALGDAADKRRFLTLQEEVAREQVSRAESGFRRAVSALTDFQGASTVTGKQLELFSVSAGTAEFAVGNLVQRLQLLGTTESGLQRLFEVEERIAAVDLSVPFRGAREILKQTIADTETLRLKLEEAGKVQIQIQPVNQNAAGKGSLLETQKILDGIGVKSQVELRREADAAASAYDRLRVLAAQGAASVRDVQRAYEAWREAEQRAVTTAGDGLQRQTRTAKEVKQQISLVLTDFSRGVVDVTKNANSLGEAMKSVGFLAVESLGRLAIEKGTKILGESLGDVILKIGTVRRLLGLGGGDSAATLANPFAGTSPSGGSPSFSGPSSGGAVSLGLNGALGAVTAISTAASAVFEGLQFFQQRRMEQDIGRSEVSLRGILSQSISIQGTLNTFFPAMLSSLSDVGSRLGRIADAAGNGLRGSGPAQVTFNLYGGNPRQVMDEVVRELRAIGAIA